MCACVHACVCLSVWRWLANNKLVDISKLKSWFHCSQIMDGTINLQITEVNKYIQNNILLALCYFFIFNIYYVFCAKLYIDINSQVILINRFHIWNASVILQHFFPVNIFVSVCQFCSTLNLTEWILRSGFPSPNNQACKTLPALSSGSNISLTYTRVEQHAG